MGRRSATRNVAAVAIQRWQRRRCEVKYAMRLLGILHVMHHEAIQHEVLVPLLQLLEEKTATRATEESEEAFPYVLELLLEVAVEYAERLHTENYTRSLLLDSYASRLRTATAAAKKAIYQHNSIRRLSILPDVMLEELMKDVVSSARAENTQKKVQEKLTWAQQAARAARQCLGDAGAALLFSHLSRPPDGVETRSTRPLRWHLQRMLVDTRGVPQSAHFFFDKTPGAEHPSAFGDKDDTVTLCDVPPLPERPFTRAPPPLADGTATDLSDVARRADTEGVGMQQPHSEGEVKDATSCSNTNSSRTDDESGSDDDYDNDRYYARQQERHRARVAQLMMLLHMDEASSSLLLEEIPTKADAATVEAAMATEAAAQRAEEEAAAQKSYMELFGEVKDVLFPVFVSGMEKTKKRGVEVTFTTARGSVAAATPPCCIVCELCDEVEEVVLCCHRCGNGVHLGCAAAVVDGAPRCSSFCRSP